MKNISLPAYISIWLSIRVWIVGVLLVFCTTNFIQDNIKYPTSSNYPLGSSVIGIITSVEYQHYGNRFGSTEWYEYNYKYSVDKHEYTGKSWSIFDNMYKVGDSGKVNYNSGNPIRSSFYNLGMTVNDTGNIIANILFVLILGIISIFMLRNRILSSYLLFTGVRREIPITVGKSSNLDNIDGYYLSATGERRNISYFHFWKKKNIDAQIQVMVGGKGEKKYTVIYNLAYGIYFDKDSCRWRINKFWISITILLNIFILLSFISNI
jgi:hypothetical protein